MARFTNKLMVLGLAAAMALPSMGHAGQVNTPSPQSTFDAGQFAQMEQAMSGQFMNMNGLGNLNALGGMANMNIGDMIKGMAVGMVTQMATQLTSKLLGQIGGQFAGGVLGQGLGGVLGQQGGLSGLSGLNTGGLTSSFGGLQGGLSSLSGSFGGLVVNNLIQAGAQAGVQALLGGIQGGSGSSSSGSINGGTSLGGITIGGNYGTSAQDLNVDAPVLSTAQVKDETSVNYKAGMLDGILRRQPDSTFKITTDTWDYNYWLAYEAGLGVDTGTASLN